MYWGALSTGISEPDRKRSGFLIRAGSEGGISFADPFEGGISFADPFGGGFSADPAHFPAVFHVGDFGACPTSLNQRFDSAGMLQKKNQPEGWF